MYKKVKRLNTYDNVQYMQNQQVDEHLKDSKENDVELEEIVDVKQQDVEVMKMDIVVVVDQKLMVMIVD